MSHTLKCWPMYFEDVRLNRKPFEVRKDDRGFREGDEVVLQEWDPSTATYSGRTATRVVGYVARGECIPAGYCVFALLPDLKAPARAALEVAREALEGLARHCSCLLGRSRGQHDYQCASNIASRALRSMTGEKGGA